MGPLNFSTYHVITHISYRGNWKLLAKFCFTQKVSVTHKFDHFSDGSSWSPPRPPESLQDNVFRSLLSRRQPSLSHPPELRHGVHQERRGRPGNQEKTTVCLQPGDAGATRPPSLPSPPGQFSPGPTPTSLPSPGSAAPVWALHQETEEPQ